MSSSQIVLVQPAPRVRGRVRPPGDKSISHRYALLAAIAHGRSSIRGYSTGGDCASTLACLRGLGVEIEQTGQDAAGLQITVTGRGLRGLLAPSGTLDAGNSGSTMRMLAGILAAHPFSYDHDRRRVAARRPMRRIIVPLERMGARIDSSERPAAAHRPRDRRVSPRSTSQPEVPSAQVKSAVLLAGLHADGHHRACASPWPHATTRNGHWRRSASPSQRAGTTVAITGGQRSDGPRPARCPATFPPPRSGWPPPRRFRAPRSLSTGVGLNPTRTGIVDVLRRMGAPIDVDGGRPAATRKANRWDDDGAPRRRAARPRSPPDEVPGVIDELPVLAALATHGGELHGQRRAGAARQGKRPHLVAGRRPPAHGRGHRRARPMAFTSAARRRLRGGEVDARNDHRLAMAFAVAALGASGPTTIHDAGAAAVSYPEFFSVLESLRA